MTPSKSLRTATLAALISLPTLSPASDLDAFILAIQHFDPAHQLGLAFDGPEVEFVTEALEAARNVAPGVSGIHVRTDWNRWDSMSPLMFKTIEIRRGDRIRSGSSSTPDSLRSIGIAIGRNCRAEVQTNESFSSSRPLGTSTRTRWDLDRKCLHENNSRTCANVEIVDWLCSRGVDLVLVSETVTHKGVYREEMYLVFRSPVDLDYMAAALMEDPLYAGTFGDLEARPYLGRLIGDGPSVEVVPCEGATGFDGICFRFSIGWGDCPAGCIHSHYWVIRCMVDGSGTGKGRSLVAELVEEGGDPLLGR
ncbi:MAG: hypothetical protein ABIK96_16355 [bacterium]